MTPEAALHIIEHPVRTEADISRLAALLNHLILHDFEGLLQLLYRVDVPEVEVRRQLDQQTGTDAGLLLAQMLLRRQAQKEHSRRQFRQKDEDIPDEERW